jgi:hypothetical protein
MTDFAPTGGRRGRRSRREKDITRALHGARLSRPRRHQVASCFPPCVSLHLFRSIGFGPERNRPPPRPRPVFRFPPGLSRKGGPPLRAGPPFLDRPGKPGRASPGGELEGPGAGRRQASAGRADEGRGGACYGAEGVNRRDDAKGSLGGEAGERWGRGRARVLCRGVGGDSSGSGVSGWTVVGGGAAVCCCGRRGDAAAVAQRGSSVRARRPGLARRRR